MIISNAPVYARTIRMVVVTIIIVFYCGITIAIITDFRKVTTVIQQAVRKCIAAI